MQYKSLLAEDPKVMNSIKIYLNKSLSCTERLLSFSYLITALEQNEHFWPDLKENILSQLDDDKNEERCVKLQGLNRLYKISKGPERILELFYEDGQELSKNFERIQILLDLFTDERDDRVVPILYTLIDNILSDSDLNSNGKWQSFLREIGRSLAKINPPLATQQIMERYNTHRKLARKVLESFTMHLYRRYAVNRVFKLSPDERNQFMSLIIRPKLERSEDSYFVLSIMILAADNEIDLKSFIEQYQRSYEDEMINDRKLFLHEFHTHLECIQANANEIEKQIKQNETENNSSHEPDIVDLFFTCITLGFVGKAQPPQNLSEKITKQSKDFSDWFNKWMSFAESAPISY